MILKIFSSISLYFFCFSAFCQQHTDYIGIEHGLSNNYVTKIYQSKNGLMWFGTYGGLNKYDGYEFTQFKNQPDKANTLPDNRIIDIIDDQEGHVWVATKLGGALLTNNNVFRKIVLQEDGKFRDLDFAINQLSMYKGKQLFGATERAGLVKIYKNKKGDPIAETIPYIRNNIKQSNYNAHVMIEDKSGVLWILVQGEGLYVYNDKSNTLQQKTNYPTGASAIETTPDGDLWFANTNGVTRYNQKNNTTKHYRKEDGLSGNRVVNLYYDQNGIMWICTDGAGITLLDTKTNKFDYIVEGPNDLTSNSIFSIYEDAQKRKWIGTLRGGVNVIDASKGKFNLIRNNAQNKRINSEDFILSFAESNDRSSLWIGTDGSGLIKWNRIQQKFTSLNIPNLSVSSRSEINKGFVTGIIADHEDNIWFSTYGGRITKINEKTGATKYYDCPYANSNHINQFLWLLYKDQNQRIWSSTINGGSILLYNEKTDRFENVNPNISDPISLYEENPNTFWFGSWDNLTKLDITTKKETKFHIGSPVRFIYRAKEADHLWLGTEGGGLLYFNKNSQKIKRYTDADGLPSNTLLNLLEDEKGIFWISTYNGICKFDPVKLTFQNFDESDGLQSNQFSYNAALKLKNGEMVFGGIRGFNIFDPNQINLNSSPPALALTNLLINNKPVDNFLNADFSDLSKIKNITVPYDEAVLSFNFAALEYSFPDKIKYAYYLDGWDKDWNYLDHQRSAHYSYLTEGKYTFRVKSTDASGVWNDEEYTLKIEILPPWWRTWWAYTVYFLLSLLPLYIYYIYLKRQTKLQYKVKVANLEIEKERELNEKKLSFFTHIAHEFRTPLTLIVNPVKEIIERSDTDEHKTELANVYNNSKRLLSLVDKLLLFRKAESDFDELRLSQLDIVLLVKDTFHCFHQMADSKSIRYQFETDATSFILTGDRDKLEISLFNLINNALKYTPNNGYVTVRIATDHTEQVIIRVEDSGLGIPNEISRDIFNLYQRDHKSNRLGKEGFGIGLFLVKKFSDAHQGSITFSANPNGSGTTFTLTLRKGVAHFNGLPIFEDTKKQSVFIDELMSETEVENTVDKTIENELQSDLAEKEYKDISEIVLDKKILMIVDDNDDIRSYIGKTFEEQFNIVQAPDAETALDILKKQEPHIIISDVMMGEMSGIDLCANIKQNKRLQHIPVILLTASSGSDIQLKGIEGGADDYITKPFDKEILVARVANLIKNRNQVQDYFYNEITLQSNDFSISEEYKEFLKKAIEIVEEHLDNSDFSVKTLADQLGMSHSNLYKRIKSISGKSANEFIRYIRLRKVAQLLIDTDLNINEAAFTAGFSDIKYFREQFTKLFGAKPSEYKKKYQTFKKKHKVNLK